MAARTRYDVVDQEDISTGLTKRYRLRIMLNGEPSKAEVAAIARQITAEYAGRTYNRDHAAARRWGATEASVVVAFFYSSIADIEGGNLVCTSQWVAQDLPDGSRPMPLGGGTDLGDGFALAWNPHHQQVAELYADTRQTKGDYLAMVDELAASLNAAQQSLSTNLDRVARSKHSEDTFIAAATEQFATIDRSNERLMESGAPPIGCNDLDQSLNGVCGHLADVVRFFTHETFLSREPSNRLLIARQSLKGAADDLTSLAQERKRAK